MIIQRLFSLALASHLLVSSLPAREATDVQPLLIGSKTPDVTVQDESGKSQRLPDLLQGEHSVVVFYRGGWCPYCNTQLQALAKAEKELEDLGYQIIAISPDSPQSLSSAEKEGDLAYRLYSDSDLSAASAFGVDFTLDQQTLDKYNEYGIDLAKASGGKNQDRLPVPSVFLVTPDNHISFTYVDPDYRFRISENLLLAAAKDGKRFHAAPSK